MRTPFHAVERYDGSASCGEGADRPSLDLPGVQLDLLEAVLATGTPTVVVLVHGRPATFGADSGGAVTSKFGPTPLTSRMGALVAAWRPGVEGGNALWSLITGAVPQKGGGQFKLCVGHVLDFVTFLISCGPPHAPRARMGVHRACCGPDEIELAHWNA